MWFSVTAHMLLIWIKVSTEGFFQGFFTSRVQSESRRGYMAVGLIFTWGKKKTTKQNKVAAKPNFTSASGEWQNWLTTEWGVTGQEPILGQNKGRTTQD